MKGKETLTSIWEILEIVQSASDSVKPAAIKMAQRVASLEMAKRREPNFSDSVEGELQLVDAQPD